MWLITYAFYFVLNNLITYVIYLTPNTKQPHPKF